MSLRDSGRQCLAFCIAFGGKLSGFVPSGVPCSEDKRSKSKCGDGLDTDQILIGHPNASMGVYSFPPCLQFFGRSLFQKPKTKNREVEFLAKKTEPGESSDLEQKTLSQSFRITDRFVFSTGPASYLKWIISDLKSISH